MIHNSGSTLLHSDYVRLVRSDLSQKEKILQLFYCNRTAHLSAEQVHELLFKDTRIPLTSTRARLSQLVTDGILMKEEPKDKGSYGVSICPYYLAPKSGQLKMF